MIPKSGSEDTGDADKLRDEPLPNLFGIPDIMLSDASGLERRSKGTGDAD